MKKYYCIFLVFFCIGKAIGKDCSQNDWKIAYQQICKEIDASESNKTLLLADSLLQIFESQKLTSCDLYLWTLYKKGEALETLRQEDKALSLYYDLIKKATVYNNWELVAQTYISIARVHEIIERPNDCLRNLKIAREIINKHDLKVANSYFALRYSSYHRIFDNLDSAIVYAKIAIQEGKKYNVKRSIVDGHLLMGILSRDESEAIYHHKQAAILFLERKAFLPASLQRMNIAKRYMQSNQIKKAIAELDTAQTYIELIPKQYSDYYIAYGYLYEKKQKLFEIEGNIDSAYFYLQKRLEAEEKAIFQTNQKEINQKEIAFAVEREQEKLLQEQKNTKYLIVGILIMALIMLVLFAAFYTNYRQKKIILKQNTTIFEKNKKLDTSLSHQTSLLSEVHHRVKNNLQLIISLTTLKSERVEDFSLKNQLQEITNKIYSIALIHEQLYQEENFERINTKEYFIKLLDYFQAFQSENQLFSVDINVKNLFLNLDTILPIGIIFTELIGNSLKHAQLPNKQLHLDLSITQQEENYIFSYKDNGKGYSKEDIKLKNNGLGMLLIESMVRQLQAKSEVNDKGTGFSMSFTEKTISKV